MKQFSLYYNYRSINSYFYTINVSLYDKYDTFMINNLFEKNFDINAIKAWLKEDQYVKIHYIELGILITINENIPKFFISNFDKSLYKIIIKNDNIDIINEFKFMINYIQKLQTNEYFK